MPELRIFIKKDEIRAKCWACGHIMRMDHKHKISNHIKNFPPKYDESAKKDINTGNEKNQKESEKGNKISSEEKKKMSMFIL